MRNFSLKRTMPFYADCTDMSKSVQKCVTLVTVTLTICCINISFHIFCDICVWFIGVIITFYYEIDTNTYKIIKNIDWLKQWTEYRFVTLNCTILALISITFDKYLLTEKYFCRQLADRQFYEQLAMTSLGESYK